MSRKNEKDRSIFFATVLSDWFVPGFVCLIKSIKIHNPSFNYKFIILNGGKGQLTEVARKKVLLAYKNVEFKEIDKSGYRRINHKPEKNRLRGAWYCLDAFNIQGCDKLIFMDSDILCVGNIDDLINTECEFGARKDAGIMINTGVMIIGSKYRQGGTYRLLLKMAKKGGRLADQTVVSKLFAKPTRKVHLIPIELNYTKRRLKKEKHSPKKWVKILQQRGIKLIHFVGSKPWSMKKKGEAQTYKNLNKLWRQYYKS